MIHDSSDVDLRPSLSGCADTIGRTGERGTLRLDFVLPALPNTLGRLGAYYVAEDGRK